ncbi:MAG TPA: FxLYD domain-containing protein [Bryobacteraceae bacterium]|jgi:hypothetical protein|nr:FxLYD domain-containing protein [Bryobacteraceae bacterium]
MKLVLILLAICLLPAAGQKKPKLPDVELVELRATRGEDRIAVDGRIKNVTDRGFRRVHISLDFLTADNKVLTTKQADLDPEDLPAGEEAEFHLQLEDAPKAAYFRVNLTDINGRELRPVSNERRPIE